MNKLALKRLTASDLTFFNSHFQKGQGSNQKAINLNADVFVRQFFPGINSLANKKIIVELQITGPNAEDAHSLVRKIIRGEGYKNWRLDGEVVHNPNETPQRFDQLKPGDIALVGFEGELKPSVVLLLLVGERFEKDEHLFSVLNDELGERRMKVVEGAVLRDLCEDHGNIPETHPVWKTTSDEDLLEASVGQAPAIDRLLSRRHNLTWSPDILRARRTAAEKIGELGEELVDHYLRQRREAGEITQYRWVSSVNAIAPFDFEVQYDDSWEKLDVKATPYDFAREYHVSLGELKEIATYDGVYRIARVYGASNDGGKMRFSVPIGEFGRRILESFSNLPEGVTPDSVSIVPDEQMFTEEIDLMMPPDGE